MDPTRIPDETERPRGEPPPMTPEQRAELQKRLDEREKSLTLDELLDSLDLITVLR